LHRNVNIVTMDAENPLGNEHLLPRGILRESPYALKRAHAVVITRFRTDHRKNRLERMIRYYDRRVPIFWSRHVPAGLRKPRGEESLDVEKMRGRKVAAVSNVADPLSFHGMLETTGAELVYRESMPDHHRYTREELQTIEKKARDAGAEMLVMTAKDERNLPEKYSVEMVDSYVLDIEAVLVEDEEKYFEIVKPVY